MSIKSGGVKLNVKKSDHMTVSSSSWLSTGTSIKSGGVKLNMKNSDHTI